MGVWLDALKNQLGKIMDDSIKNALIQMRKTLCTLHRCVNQGGAPDFLIDAYSKTHDVFYELVEKLTDECPEESTDIIETLSAIN